MITGGTGKFRRQRGTSEHVLTTPKNKSVQKKIRRKEGGTVRKGGSITTPSQEDTGERRKQVPEKT